MGRPYTMGEINRLHFLAGTMPVSEMAKIFGRSKTSLHQAAVRHGIRVATRPYEPLKECDRKTVVSMRNQGCSFPAIAEATGIPYRRVRNIYRCHACR